MKKTYPILLFISMLLLTSCDEDKISSQENEDLNTKDIYLGQKAPGMTPELFAPEIVHSEHREGAYAFSPDLKEFYLRRRGGQYENNTLVVIKKEKGHWVESVFDPKTGEPFISYDNKTMHLGRYYRERSDTGWSEAKSLDSNFTKYRIMRLTSTKDKTYYFDEASEDGPLRYSRLVDGKHEEARVAELNVGPWNAHPFIAPDESYIIWDDQREDNFGGADLYISFRNEDGSWGAAINMGEGINSEFEDMYGSISPDGKYFFFVRSYGGDKADLFWLDAKIIFDLRNK